MGILLASEITWTPPRRCPACGVGITAYGKSQPFAVDDAGRVYCRRHGETADATYVARFAEYQANVRPRLDAYLAEGSGGPLTTEELKAADAELR